MKHFTQYFDGYTDLTISAHQCKMLASFRTFESPLQTVINVGAVHAGEHQGIHEIVALLFKTVDVSAHVTKVVQPVQKEAGQCRLYRTLSSVHCFP